MISLKQFIFPHNAWVFVKPATESIEVQLIKDSDTVMVEVVPDKPRAFPRLNQQILVGNTTYEPTPAKTPHLLHIATCTTEKRVYRPGEEVHVILFAAREAHQLVDLTIYNLDQILLTKTIELDTFGTGTCRLEQLDNGSYRAEMGTPGGISRSTEFTVAPFTLSPLQVLIRDQTVKDDVLSITASVLKLNTSYTGSIRIDFKCGFCGDDVVDSVQAQVDNGTVKFQWSMSGHSGPFTLVFMTPDGSNATKLLEGTKTEEREELLLNTIGPHTRCALLPHKGANEVRGLYLWEEGSSTWPIGLLEAVHREVKLTAMEPLAALTCVQFDPTKPEHPIFHEFFDINTGVEVTFPNLPPYSIIRCGVITKIGDVFQGSIAVMHPHEVELGLSAPEHAKPGEEIEVTLQVTNPPSNADTVKCYLMIMDSRLERNDDVARVAKSFFAHLKSAQATWKNTKVCSIVEFEEEQRRWQEDMNKQEEAKQDRFRFFSRAAKPSMKMTSSSGVLPLLEAGKVGMLSAMRDFATDVVLEAKMDDSLLDLGGGVVAEAAPDDDGEGVDHLPPMREELPLIWFEELEVSARHPVTRTIPLGEQTCTWRIEALVLHDVDCLVVSKYIEASLTDFCEINVPVYLEEDDQCSAVIQYKTQIPGTLRVETYQDIQEFQVAGSGIQTIPLNGPTEVIVELLQGDTIIDRVRKLIKRLGTEEVTVSRIEFGKAGQTFEGETVIVYPSLGVLLSESAKALVAYPFGCAEQTASKIKGLITVWKAADRGVIHTGIVDITDMLSMGLNRMHNFFHEARDTGLFSLWENGIPSSHVTAIVLNHLAGVRDISLESAAPVKQMIQKAVKALKQESFQDTKLIGLDPAFGTQKVASTEEAAYYLLGEDRSFDDSALAYLEKHIIESETEARWPAKTAWGGELESTCLALQAYVRRNHHSNLVEKGLKYVGSRLINGRLYSTSDTAAMLDLFSELATTQVSMVEVLVDGTQQTVTEPLICSGVQILSDALVRVDSREIIDYTHVSSAFKFTVDIETQNLALGERTRMTITPTDQATCPIAHVYFAGNTAAIQAGANLQLVVTPIKNDKLVLDFVGVQKGTCRMRVVVRDMYDAVKVGYSLPIKITVG